VTVNADAPLLKTETGDLSHNVASERLDDLPVLGFYTQVRNPFAVTQLLPGTNSVGGSIRVNGSPSNTQSIRIEGQDALSGLLVGSTSMSQPSVDG
jgi:hypothetical protein